VPRMHVHALSLISSTKKKKIEGGVGGEDNLFCHPFFLLLKQ
jgi:hypothetical protein